MVVPVDPKIFHITHVENLAGIVREGGLCCDRECIARRLTSRGIGYNHIKARRLRRMVPTSMGGSLGDYVPFNFCPRSVMRHRISIGHSDYQGGEDSVVHLVSCLSAIERCACRWAFTDRHAVLDVAEYFERREDLREVRWDVMPRFRWPSVKEVREAEFLVHAFVPWNAIVEVVAKNESVAYRVRSAIVGLANPPAVRIEPKWYYKSGP